MVAAGGLLLEVRYDVVQSAFAFAVSDGLCFGVLAPGLFNVSREVIMPYIT